MHTYNVQLVNQKYPNTQTKYSYLIPIGKNSIQCNSKQFKAIVNVPICCHLFIILLNLKNSFLETYFKRF